MSDRPAGYVVLWHFGTLPPLCGARPRISEGAATTVKDFFVLPTHLRCQACELGVYGLGVLLLEATWT